MFRKILVPTDFSKKHINPLEIAANLSSKYDSAIHLLHVVEIIADTTFAEYEDFYGKMEIRAQKRMSSLIASQQKKAVRIIPPEHRLWKPGSGNSQLSKGIRLI